MEQTFIDIALRNIEAIKAKIVLFEIFGTNMLIRAGKRKEPKTAQELYNEKIELYDYIENLDWDIHLFEDEVRNNYHSCKNKSEREFCLNEYKLFLRKVKLNFNLNNQIPYLYGYYLDRVKIHFILENLEIDDTIFSENELKESYEIALRHWFLENHKIEPMIFGNDIVQKYNGKKRIETYVNEIRKGLRYNRRNLYKQLVNVKESLNNYPQIQLEINIHLDQIS